ncbi:hypothetical protein IAR55_005822 [Kwoniella newhampshirensis]|uniref:Uncharacterized protein n=1 Tax=Kwoniella newhampshirensis TaxID=1651941 RepID=A0AAW0YVG6_9TREE
MKGPLPSAQRWRLNSMEAALVLLMSLPFLTENRSTSLAPPSKETPTRSSSPHHLKLLRPASGQAHSIVPHSPIQIIQLESIRLHPSSTLCVPGSDPGRRREGEGFDQVGTTDGEAETGR